MPFDAKPEFVHTTCPHDCPSTCALEVERLDARTIGKVRGARDNPYTAGVICSKVARYAERVHHPDRLMRPLRRVGERGCGIDGFQPISWDDALDEIAEALLKAEQRFGPETVWPYYYAGTMGHVQRDGIHRLRHVKKYSRQYDTICTMLAESGWKAGVGDKAGVDSREIEHSDVVVVWGCNPVNTQVNVMTHIARAKKTRGAKLVVVDPYRTGTAEQADLHLGLKPGTDAALACAVMHCAFRDGDADRDYMAKYTDDPAGLEAHVKPRDPAWASEITGLAVGQIEAFAQLYNSTKRSFIRIGYGFSRSRNGATNVHAASCLPAVTGAWQVEGGGALWGNGAIYHLDKTMIEGLDALDRSVRKLDQSRIGPVLVNDPSDLQGGPPVTALFIQNTNPMVVAPELVKVHQGFRRDDLFVAVHEQFLTETAQMADILIPATSFLEHDDYYTASGHTFLQITKAVIEPPGECRSNHQVICALAKRLGAEHPGFEMTEWELIERTFKDSGHPPAEQVWADHWLDCSEPFEKMHFLDGFPQPDGKFRFRAIWSDVGRDHEGMPGLPDYWESIDQIDERHPFRLVAAPARTFLNTSFTETPGSQKRERRPTVMTHPDVLAKLGLADGDRVRIGNEQASILLHVESFDGLQPDVLIVESIWPNHAFEEGLSINALVSADPGKPRGGAVFHDTAVWLRPAN